MVVAFGIIALLLIMFIAVRVIMVQKRRSQKKLKEVVNVKYAFLLNKKVS